MLFLLIFWRVTRLFSARFLCSRRDDDFILRVFLPVLFPDVSLPELLACSPLSSFAAHSACSGKGPFSWCVCSSLFTRINFLSPLFSPSLFSDFNLFFFVGFVPSWRP